jgi:hypothetical protein
MQIHRRDRPIRIGRADEVVPRVQICLAGPRIGLEIRVGRLEGVAPPLPPTRRHNVN